MNRNKRVVKVLFNILVIIITYYILECHPELTLCRAGLDPASLQKIQGDPGFRRDDVMDSLFQREADRRGDGKDVCFS
ncbi:hypothetical protein A2716_02895 [candidate division WWE3 bacterium RIFCSPHIGHO2_01_FULL_40_23]|nr:MAG: hypothetical protein A2716_02895 [candidate division WWE3 bacterium RIFCSPHIGHO2_01_FULL_40_23]